MKLIQTLCALAVVALSEFTAANDEFPTPINTQAAGEHPPSPQEMLELFELPPGFKVTLFAGEPDVQQPICFDFDDTGRLWVAENYTYSAHGKIDPNLRDRVVILHDKDGDGQHDERKVFWDKGSMLTSLTWGYGGLWILNDGTLSFIPDKNGDDIPDSEPVEMLNGWTKNAGHNFVNGLLWGPDGWLYGRHGITDTSYPGTPDTPVAERPPINCGIWRFHPIKHTFEVVCHGTTNPWGLDYNEVGDMFMSNNVIGHLWHVIPRAHYERMFGQDFNPHCYELMGPISDHYHWDNTGKWSESRDGKADDLGGGHSHCGLMLYYGQNFPKEYWGKAFMCNTHGRCVNVDRIERKGSSYVAKHEPNFLKVNTPWFRGVQLAYGPAGCMYLSDWSDNGECHDHDGVHRTSGRIYRISYGEVNTLANRGTKGMWSRRRGWREFMHGLPIEDREAALSLLTPNARREDDKLTVEKIAAVAFHDAIDVETAAKWLEQADPDHRAATLRFVFQDDRLTADLWPQIIGLLLTEESPVVVRTCLSAMPHMSPQDAATVLIFIANKNQQNKTFGSDNVLQKMLWYGVQPHARHPSLGTCISKSFEAFPNVFENAVRQEASDWKASPKPVEARLMTAAYLSHSADKSAIERALAILKSVLRGSSGLSSIPTPNNWGLISDRLNSAPNVEIQKLAKRLAARTGDLKAVEDLRQLVMQRDAEQNLRSDAVRSIA